jgi:hypothetical protein
MDRRPLESTLLLQHAKEETESGGSSKGMGGITKASAYALQGEGGRA